MGCSYRIVRGARRRLGAPALNTALQLGTSVPQLRKGPSPPATSLPDKTRMPPTPSPIMMTPQAFLYSQNNNTTTITTSSHRNISATARAHRRPSPRLGSPLAAAPSQLREPPLQQHSSSSSGFQPLVTPARSLAGLPTQAPALEFRESSSFRKHDRKAAHYTATTREQPTAPDTVSPRIRVDDTMGKRRDVTSRLTPPSSPPSTAMSNTMGRSSTTASAVEIPISTKFDSAHKHHKSRHHTDAQRRTHCSPVRRSRDTHSPDAISPSMAALLAITAIPPPGRRTNVRSKQLKPNQMIRMTVDSIVPRSQVSEKELSRELDDESPLLFGHYGGLSRSPMDILLSPPEELEEDVISVASDGAFTPPFSTRAASFDSIPSLGDSLSTSGLPSLDSPLTPRGRRYRQPRRSLEPVVSPVGEEADHPLSKRTSAPEFGFGIFDASPVSLEKKETSPQLALKSVFKSNLTASLRALRSAARSLSNFTASSIPPEDFLTRSILTMDPRVPFTDERMPPVLDQEPSEAMRRYLNPTTTVRPESRSSSSVRNYTASIQMQTYKVQRSKSGGSSNGRSNSSSSSKSSPALVLLPGPRQREVRENSDFIRIAVLEHLMRKSGKFDEQREGHARWVLPARKLPTKPYEIGANGVPARWVSISQDASSE